MRECGRERQSEGEKEKEIDDGKTRMNMILLLYGNIKKFAKLESKQILVELESLFRVSNFLEVELSR